MNSTASVNLINDLVDANHILYNEGIVDGFGHVSVRHDGRDDRFLIARAIAPATVQANDILECDYLGEPQDTLNRKTYLERYIHSEIYAARPDVVAIVHSHSPAIIPFGVTQARLRPICHMSGFLGLGVPNFEIREFESLHQDLLIRTRKLGTHLAQTLGSAHFALMRGHGSVTVAPSLRLVVARAIWAESNAKLQSEAMRFGEVKYLNAAEAHGAMTTNEAIIERPWALWKAKLNGSV